MVNHTRAYTKKERENVVNWYKHFMHIKHPAYHRSALRRWALNAGKMRYDMDCQFVCTKSKYKVCIA